MSEKDFHNHLLYEQVQNKMCCLRMIRCCWYKKIIVNLQATQEKILFNLKYNSSWIDMHKAPSPPKFAKETHSDSTLLLE